MTFGYHGFSFDHADEWEPVSLSGKLNQGYARLANPQGGAIQVRWEPSRAIPNLKEAAQNYLKQLRKDARKEKVAFDCQMVDDGDATTFQVQSTISRRGSLLHCPHTNRTFIIEVSSARKSNQERVLKSLVRSFQSGGEMRLWSFLGLAVRIPSEFVLVRTTLVAGRTAVELKSPRAKVTAERWGFAEDLIRAKGFANWLEAVSRVRGDVIESESGITIFSKRRFPLSSKKVIARVQPERNQVVWVMLEGGIGRGALIDSMPDWEWIV